VGERAEHGRVEEQPDEKAGDSKDVSVPVLEGGQEDKPGDDDSPASLRKACPPAGTGACGSWLVLVSRRAMRNRREASPIYQNDESGDGQQRAESVGVQELAPIMRPALGSGARAEDGSNGDEDGCHDNKYALPESWHRAVAYESPDDVIGIDQVE